MYFYEIGYHSHEECPMDTIMHENEFSQEEFNEMVATCAAKAYKEKDQKRITEERFDYLMDRIIDFLSKDYGFQRPVITASFKPFGWSDMGDPDDWNEVINDQNKLITSKILDSQ